MAGGVAVFDFNNDGRPDIFFANGANIETLKKDAPKFSNRLYRNDGKGVFTDVTKEAGLTGTGYDMCVAVETTTTTVIGIYMSVEFTAIRCIATTVTGHSPTSPPKLA